VIIAAATGKQYDPEGHRPTCRTHAAGVSGTASRGVGGHFRGVRGDSVRKNISARPPFHDASNDPMLEKLCLVILVIFFSSSGTASARPSPGMALAVLHLGEFAVNVPVDYSLDNM